MQKLTAKLMEAMYALKHRSEHKNSKGFTLIELVVVIAIIAVLLALIAPNLIGYLGQAKSTKSMATAKSVYTATCAKNAAKPISKSAGLVKIAMTTGDLADYFNQEEIKDIKDGKVTAFMNNGTIEGVKVEYEDGSPAVYYPEGCEALFEGGEAEELAPDESPYGGNESEAPSGGPGVYYNGELIKSWDELEAESIINTENNYASYEEYGFSICNPSKFTALGNVDEFVVKDDVTYIGGYAFYGRSELKKIYIPNSVTKIGNYAFGNCSGLTHISIANVESIGDSSFNGCSSLTDVTLSSNLRSIGTQAFNSCGFTTISLPNSLESLGEAVFSYSKLETITVPSSVTILSRRCFTQCPELREVTINANITKIGDYTFEQDPKLETVRVNSPALKEIMKYAFVRNVMNVELNVYVPSTVEKMGTTSYDSSYDNRVFDEETVLHYAGTAPVPPSYPNYGAKELVAE